MTLTADRWPLMTAPPPVRRSFRSISCACRSRRRVGRPPTAWSGGGQRRERGARVLSKHERLLGEPGAGGGVGEDRAGLEAPQRVECQEGGAGTARPARDGRRVGGIIPAAYAARSVTLTIRLARCLDPQVGVEQRRVAGQVGVQ